MSTRHASRRRRRRGWGIALLIGVGSFAVAAVTPGVANLGAAATRTPALVPKTVLLVGDSLLHQGAMGISDALPGTNVVDASVPGSGLLDGPVDWAARAAELTAQYHPDIVVVSFVGNYDSSEGTLVADSPAYYAAWAQAAQRLTAALRASGARVDWVAQPPLSDPNFYGVAASRTAKLLVDYRRLATEPGVALVDAVDAVSTSAGTFTESGDVCGSAITLRIADGVHFTDAGGDWWGANLGRAVAHLEHLPARGVCAVMADLDGIGN